MRKSKRLWDREIDIETFTLFSLKYSEKTSNQILRNNSEFEYYLFSPISIFGKNAEEKSKFFDENDLQSLVMTPNTVASAVPLMRPPGLPPSVSAFATTCVTLKLTCGSREREEGKTIRREIGIGYS